MFRLMSIQVNARQFSWEFTICPGSSGAEIDCTKIENEFCSSCASDSEYALMAEINSEEKNKNNFKRVSPDLQRENNLESILSQYQRKYIQARCDQGFLSWC